MAFCITFGTHDFTSQLEGYENARGYCQNCRNWDAYCQTRWPFFTICWIPLIPLSIHKYKEVHCPRCRFSQDLEKRPDITPQTRPPQGYGQYGQPQYGPPPQAHYGPPPQAQGGLPPPKS